MLDWMHSEQGNKRGSGALISLENGASHSHVSRSSNMYQLMFLITN